MFLCVYNQLILANPGPLVIGKLHLSHFADMLGHDNIFLTVADAVESCCPKLSNEVWNYKKEEDKDNDEEEEERLL